MAKTVKLMMMTVAACALAIGNVQAENVRSKTGTLIVYRKFSLAGCAASMPFWVNGKFVAKLTNGYYYKLELPEGEYTLTHDTILAGPDPQKVTLKAGQTTYFCNYCNMGGRVWEVADDQDGARQSVSHLKQQTWVK